MPHRPARPAPPREVRIIGGLWKRTKLPVADKPGLRPTLDRVRETLFNWLGQDLDGWHCLDAFAGTGALGFEAASRGAAAVWMLEADAQLVHQLKTTRDRLQGEALHIENTDALRWMRASAPARFDLVLLDPPFSAGLFEAALRAATPLLRPGGWLYLESDAPPQPSWLSELGLSVWRESRAGAVHFCLLQPSAP
ncbi:16S rRNA (guanine(966)-N(2))-methyltransferase RsmD [Aquabacterium sp. A7-Y]|uniref:16S rRNA (guanine(966)-N(2))-methyltransferase RsmD n=1 Tax=Aquabacterium sp. A7-Y TaxID=1349605 RepID=UPI00223E7451|nr:16S rRNA (guanine(966)-N(2))-methyltransferase RsmD [Aquabacterium sp. A7-Y]MCW7537473.1 16S rRNA (guanine(966)-N(2))-methyltransferase RsmD [Aquabacterium sp. A7-Y]